MEEPEMRPGEETYVGTPRGIFTASGVWFRTTEDMLRAYAGEVFEREPLPRLLHDAEVWLRSPQTLTLWFLPLLLLLLPPAAAAFTAVVLFLLWDVVGPAVVSRTLVNVLRPLENVLLQALLYVASLSVLASAGHYAALGVGLVGFVLLRWGVLERAAKPVTAPMKRSLYTLPVPDHVLRAMIVRTALKYRISLPELEQIERQVLDVWKRK